MDAIDTVPKHYEYVIENQEIEASLLVKLQALDAMKSLDGWCTRCKASTLMDLIFVLKPSTVVEIGVFGGMSLVPMAYAVKHNGQGIVYGIDPWSTDASVDGMEGANESWWSSINHETIMKKLITRIDMLGLKKQVKLIRESSEDTAPIPNIDLLHIDGNHSEKTSYQDVTKWVPLVRQGGIIVFDDLNWATTAKAVEYLNDNCVKVAEFYGDNIWGVWIKP